MIKTDSCFLAIDKPAGISSFEVIRRLRRITGIRKIGHTGTLDPFATGLLICCLGSYTRLASLVESADKTYLAKLKFGVRSSTGDPEGEIVETASLPSESIDWQEIADRALSLQELPVPIYSAVKVDGNRAYSLARKGLVPDLPKRPTRILSMEVLPETLEVDSGSVHGITYRCTVSKGTYIRSLSEWLAEQAASIGITIELRREAVADIQVGFAGEIDLLSSENWRQYVLDPRIVLAGLPVYEVDSYQAAKIQNGSDLPYRGDLGKTRFAIYHNNSLIAIALKNKQMLHPEIVLA